MTPIRALRRLIRRLLQMPTRTRCVIVFVVSGLVCWADLGLTRPSVQMIGYHLLPILMSAWLCSRRVTGLVTALSLSTSLLVAHQALQPDAPLWEAVLAYASVCLVLAGFALTAVGMRAVFLRLENERNTDPLTGLRNRRSFLELATYELAASARRRTVTTLASIDLDDFKRVNDTLGHAAGDQLLVEIGACLRRGFRKTDCIGRLGGDEFAVLLPDANEAEAAAVLDKVRRCLQPVFERFGGVAGISVGTVSTQQGAPTTVDALLALADERMYVTKRAAKGRLGRQ